MLAFMHNVAHTAVHNLCTGYAACLHTVSTHWSTEVFEKVRAIGLIVLR